MKRSSRPATYTTSFMAMKKNDTPPNYFTL